MLQTRKIPQQERSKQRVAAIIDVASQLLVSHGYAKFSTNLVARTAGVNIASLYQYFPNKEALIYAINREMLDEVLVELERIEREWLETLAANCSWQTLFQNLNDKLRSEPGHVKLVRELDFAISTNAELQAMEYDHSEKVAAFFKRLLRHSGSQWPEQRLLNTGRLLYQYCSFSLYDMGALDAEDERESQELHDIALHALVNAALANDNENNPL